MKKVNLYQDEVKTKQFLHYTYFVCLIIFVFLCFALSAALVNKKINSTLINNNAVNATLALSVFVLAAIITQIVLYFFKKLKYVNYINWGLTSFNLLFIILTLIVASIANGSLKSVWATVEPQAPHNLKESFFISGSIISFSLFSVLLMIAYFVLSFNNQLKFIKKETDFNAAVNDEENDHVKSKTVNTSIFDDEFDSNRTLKINETTSLSNYGSSGQEEDLKAHSNTNFYDFDATRYADDLEGQGNENHQPSAIQTHKNIDHEVTKDVQTKPLNFSDKDEEIDLKQNQETRSFATQRLDLDDENIKNASTSNLVNQNNQTTNHLNQDLEDEEDLQQQALKKRATDKKVEDFQVSDLDKLDF